MTGDGLSIVLSALLSGLIGVLISNYYHKNASKKKQKYDLLEQLMGNRYSITGEKFTEALNKIFIVYNDNNQVLMKLKNFHDCILERPDTVSANEKLSDLFIEMCRDLNIDVEIMGDGFYLQPFNI